MVHTALYERWPQVFERKCVTKDQNEAWKPGSLAFLHSTGIPGRADQEAAVLAV